MFVVGTGRAGVGGVAPPVEGAEARAEGAVGPWPGKVVEEEEEEEEEVACCLGGATGGGLADGGGPRRWSVTLAPSVMPHSPRVCWMGKSLPRCSSLQVWGCHVLSLTIVSRVCFRTNTVSVNSASRCKGEPCCTLIVKDIGIGEVRIE